MSESQHHSSESKHDDSHPNGPVQRRATFAETGPTTAIRRLSTRATTFPSVARTSTRQTLSRIISSNFTPARKVGVAPGVWKSLRNVALGSWWNVLLVCIPISWALNFADKGNDRLIFVFSLFAILPLAKLLAFATDELSLRVGQTLAGLLNATLGNVVELIVAIIAVTQCELQIVQSSLIGSILSNLLLVLGMCFFAGGCRFSEQGFGASATQINSSLLTISVIALLLPAAFHMAVESNPDNNLDLNDEGSVILKMSHGVAIILLFIYGSYLIFQLWSHSNLYEDNFDGNFKSTKYVKKDKGGKETDSHDSKGSKLKSLFRFHNKSDESASPTTAPTDTINNARTDVEANVGAEQASGVEEEQRQDEPQVPKLSLGMSIGLLICVTVVVAVTAEWLVRSINGITANSNGLSKEWVGLILLPIAGNAAEHVTAVTVSVKDKLTLSIGVAVGSSIQIALFVIPFIVILAWILGKPLLLLFDPFESVTLFLAVITVNYAVQDGKSNWLEGMILMCLYVIIAVSFWFYPGSDIGSFLNKCT